MYIVTTEFHFSQRLLQLFICYYSKAYANSRYYSIINQVLPDISVLFMKLFIWLDIVYMSCNPMNYKYILLRTGSHLAVRYDIGGYQVVKDAVHRLMRWTEHWSVQYRTLPRDDVWQIIHIWCYTLDINGQHGSTRVWEVDPGKCQRMGANDVKTPNTV
jgi:hypothetical protein